jgi:hypothetical protein
MNGDPRLIKQVKTIATNATKTVGTEKVILNGKVVELPKGAGKGSCFTFYLYR